MLERLLRLATRSGSAEVATLARDLEVSPRQVALMLETLEHRGYLAQTGIGCDRPCAGCPLRAACPREQRERVWALTPKGARLLARSAGGRATAP